MRDRLFDLIRARPGSRPAVERRNLGRCAALVILAWLVGYVVVSGMGGGYRSSDWPNAMILARLLWTNPGHLYDHAAQVQTQLSLLGAGGFVGQPGGVLRLSSPPYLGLLSSLVAGAGLDWGGIAWCLLQLACLVTGLVLIAENRTDAIFAAAGIPAWIMVANANAVGLVVLGLGLFWRLRTRYPWLAGTSLGIAMVRPNVMIPLPLLFLLNREWKVLAGSAVALAALVASVEVIHSGLTLSWVATVLGQAGHIGPDLTPAGIGWALGAHLGWLFTAAGLLVGLYLARRGGAAMFPAALLASPHALVQSLLLVSAGLAAARRCGFREIALLNGGALGLILVSSNPLLEAVGGTALLVGFTWLLRNDGETERSAYSVGFVSEPPELVAAGAAA